MSMLDHPSVPGPQEAPQPDQHSDQQSDQQPCRHLKIRPWWDPDLAVTGHRIDSEYVEQFMLGVLGPSVICLLRRISRGFQVHPNGFGISLPDTARAIGLGTGIGRQAPVNRTIDRACTFNIARRISSEELEVRLHVPSLTARQLARLPLAVRNSHARWTQEHSALHLDAARSIPPTPSAA